MLLNHRVNFKDTGVKWDSSNGRPWETAGPIDHENYERPTRIETRKEYLVKWAALPYRDCTWETEGSIRDLDALVKVEEYQSLNSAPPQEPVLTNEEVASELDMTRHLKFPATEFPLTAEGKVDLSGMQMEVHSHFLTPPSFPPLTPLHISSLHSLLLASHLVLASFPGHFCAQTFPNPPFYLGVHRAAPRPTPSLPVPALGSERSHSPPHRDWTRGAQPLHSRTIPGSPARCQHNLHYLDAFAA